MKIVMAIFLGSLGMFCSMEIVQAQDSPIARTQSSQQSGEEPAEDPATTVFPHSELNRFWVSGQLNFIEQWHPAFHSPYQLHGNRAGATLPDRENSVVTAIRRRARGGSCDDRVPTFRIEPFLNVGT